VIDLTGLQSSFRQRQAVCQRLLHTGVIADRRHLTAFRALPTGR
jgi:hypothetical protein